MPSDPTHQGLPAPAGLQPGNDTGRAGIREPAMSRKTNPAPANPSRRTVLRAGAIGATASALPSGLAHARPRDRPNIVLVVLDQMTERLVSAHGGASIDTPELDRLVSMGTSF